MFREQKKIGGLVLLATLYLLVIPATTVAAFSSHNTTLSRTVSPLQCPVNDVISVTARFTSFETDDLHGFYYVDNIPEGLSVVTEGVRFGGHDISNYVVEVGSSGDVYADCVPYRWILETPPDFLENNPIGFNDTIEIAYSITSISEGDYHLNDYHWVGYYDQAPLELRAAFGHSDAGDEKTITFYEEQHALCECTLVPNAAPAVVPRGGSLGFQATITNNTDLAGRIHFVTFLTPPPPNSRYPAAGWLDHYTPRMTPSGTPNSSRTGHLSLPIPEHWPLGTYTYQGQIGKPGPVIYDECQFVFEVVAP
jgi:hypothetical protein